MTVKINVLAGWVCHATSLLIGFFLMPYVLGIVGDASYGTWLLLNSMAGYTALLYLGFGETITRFVSQHYARQEWDKLNETISGIFAAYLVSGTIACLAAGVLAALAPYLNSWEGQSLTEVRWAIMILGLNAALSICGSINGGVLYGIQRFDIERGIQITCQIVRAVLVVLVDRQSSAAASAVAHLHDRDCDGAGPVLHHGPLEGPHAANSPGTDEMDLGEDLVSFRPV